MKLKELKILALGSNGAILARAQGLLAAAPAARHARVAQHRRNGAAALAVFLVVPLRLRDTAWRFGDSLFWDGAQYCVDVRLSKANDDERRFRARLDERLTPFIDALVLHGADARHLDAERDACIATRRALFVDHNGAECTYGYVSRVWKRYLGAGVHIARSRMHDERGALGDEGVRQAMAMCGQVSVGIEKEYQTRAFSAGARVWARAALNAEVDDATLAEYPEVAFAALSP